MCIYEKRLETRAKAHGETHQLVAHDLNNFAAFLARIGKLEEAVSTAQRASLLDEAVSF